MRTHQQGVTLVELAIVLFILGLLIAGISSGYELIVQSRAKATIRDIEGIMTAVHAYTDRYRAFPGDDVGGSRWSGSVSGNGNARIEGLYNAVSSNPPTSNEESNLFWWHLRQAGLVGGILDSSQGPLQPLNAADGRFGVQDANGALGLNGLILCTSVSDKVAITIDNALDDGNPATGSVRAMVGTFDTPLVATPTANYAQNGDFYLICTSIRFR